MPVPENVWSEYQDSERINDRGILVDQELVKSAIALDQQSQVELVEGLRELTNLHSSTEGRFPKNRTVSSLRTT